MISLRHAAAEQRMYMQCVSCLQALFSCSIASTICIVPPPPLIFTRQFTASFLFLPAVPAPNNLLSSMPCWANPAADHAATDRAMVHGRRRLVWPNILFYSLALGTDWAMLKCHSWSPRPMARWEDEGAAKIRSRMFERRCIIYIWWSSARVPCYEHG
jgi:hypothetical protein